MKRTLEHDDPAAADTPTRILEAATDLLAEVGYDGVSMRAVAQAAGVNKALVFYHFANKATLIERVLARYYEAHLEGLARAFDRDGDGDESVAGRFHRLVDAYLDFIEANLRYPRIVQQQVAGSDTHHELVRRNLAPLYRWVVEALSELAPEAGPCAARHFFVTLSGIVINYFTYARVLAPLWGHDPLGPEGLAERRAHVHWIVDTLIQRLVDEAPLMAPAPAPAPAPRSP